MRVPTHRLASLLLAASLAVASATCGGDNLTKPGPEDVGGPSFAAGPAATIKLNAQPPPSALNREVWDPSRQPIVVVKDANGVVVPSAVVAASIGTGSGALQGKLTATTNVNGVAKFVDLGINGTGPHTLRFTNGSAVGNSSTVTLNALPPEATSGKWDAPASWDIVPLHISLLPTGKVLAWGKFEAGTGNMADPRLWNPAAGSPGGAARIAAPNMLFCSGHALMADGRLLVSGGHKADDRGLKVTNIFDPVSERWTPGLPEMSKGRWYPTVTELADGRMVTVSGRDSTSTAVLVPEIWEAGHWVPLPGASLKLPYYPYQFLAPNGKLFYAGERIQARWLDVDATGTNGGRGKWTSGAKHLWLFNRDYGSAVMYEAGKILFVGGGGHLTRSTTTDPKSSTPTATAEIIDLNVTPQAWKNTDPMNVCPPAPQRHHSARRPGAGDRGNQRGRIQQPGGSGARGGGVEPAGRALDPAGSQQRQPGISLGVAAAARCHGAARSERRRH